MYPRIIALVICGPLLCGGLALAQTAPAAPAPTQAGRFERQVLAYEAEDRARPPPKRAILFAGDSQFFRWKTIREDLPGYSLINRGIDSFQIEHLIQYADRLVLPHEPRLIVLHAGGNDVHNGKSPARVLADFQAFVARVRAKYPDVPIVFSSITPGPGRWDEAPQRIETNRVLREFIATQRNLAFVDLWGPMLTVDGRPREDLWVADRVHPNHAGYRLRVELTKPFLGEPDRPL
jgi:lysophospholipase L1-like esterase